MDKLKKALLIILVIFVSFSLGACQNNKITPPETPGGDTPETPGGGDTPETPETPGGGDTPETPETPGGGDTPETPDIPGGGDTPETPETPGGSVNTGSLKLIKDGEVKITKGSIWYESVYFNWNNNSIKDVKVHYKLSSSVETEYKPIDQDLIIDGSIYVMGLKGGEKYNIRICRNDVLDGQTVYEISTMEFDRSGYAFSQGSPNKFTSGGYEADGTVKEATDVLYITQDNKNTIPYTVYKGSQAISCLGFGQITAAMQSAKSTKKIIFRFIGVITPPTGMKGAEVCNLKDSQNITFEGVGMDSGATRWGFQINNCQNIEIRNMRFGEQKEDSISIEGTGTNSNIWVHNNLFKSGANGGGDKTKGDGSCDIKDDSTYITIDNNVFDNTGKSSLCGMKSETKGKGFITYHHNWYASIGSRAPRIRVITVHSYNNYFDHNYSAGVAATTGSSVFSEANYFEDAVRPLISASQGNSIKGEDGSDFCSGEDGGVIKSYGDVFASCGGSHTYIDGSLKTVTKKCEGNTLYNPYNPINPGSEANPGGRGNTGYDCYVASDRNEKVSDSFKAVKGGATYNNFDTEENLYKYNVDTAEVAKEKVKKYAGTMKIIDNEEVKAKQVEEAILEIGTVEFTNQTLALIVEAERLYSKLSETDKTNVSNYAILTSARENFNALEVLYVKGLITSIGMVGINSGAAIQKAQSSYNGLSKSQQEQIDNYDVLQRAIEAFATFAIQAVTNKIDEIGTVTIAKESLILEAREEYNNLSSSQKMLITNYNVLVESEGKLLQLQNVSYVEGLIQDVDLANIDSLKEVIEAYEDLTVIEKSGLISQEQMSNIKVQYTIKLIDAIGSVTINSNTIITIASDYYNSLTAIEKEKVANYSILEVAKIAYEELQNFSQATSFASKQPTNSYFTASGNYTTSGGSATYNGTTYSESLKMESATIIAFETTSVKKLILVFSSLQAGKKVKVDGVTYTADTNGVVTINNLVAGSHSISKGDTANLFYICVK